MFHNDVDPCFRSKSQTLPCPSDLKDVGRNRKVERFEPKTQIFTVCN